MAPSRFNKERKREVTPFRDEPGPGPAPGPGQPAAAPPPPLRPTTPGPVRPSSPLDPEQAVYYSGEMTPPLSRDVQRDTAIKFAANSKINLKLLLSKLCVISPSTRTRYRAEGWLQYLQIISGWWQYLQIISGVFRPAGHPGAARVDLLRCSDELHLGHP